MATKTASPTGMTLTREGGNYTATWKIGATSYNAGQEARYRVWYANGTYSDWKNATGLSTQDTSYTFNIYSFSMYPQVAKYITEVQFSVRGRYRVSNTDVYDWSDWVSKSFKIYLPEKPKIQTTQTAYGNVTISISEDNNDKTGEVYHSMEYTSVLIKDNATTNGASVNWDSPLSRRVDETTQNLTAEFSISELGTLLSDGHSYTRWTRARSRGPAGPSAWVYSRTVFAEPNVPEIESANAKVIASGYQITMQANLHASVLDRPVDHVRMEYTVAEPEADMTPPPNAGATTAQTFSIPEGNSYTGASFSISTPLGYNQCLWVRAVAINNFQETASGWYLVQVGKISPPTDLVVSNGSAPNTIRISATNNGPAASNLFVKYFTRYNSVTIGLIESGQTTIISRPDWDDSGVISVGVYSAIGSYTVDEDYAYDLYTVDAKMKSAVTRSGGTIPTAPDLAVRGTETPGTIRATWTWTWAGAQSMELSWADHADAWESTDSPSIYDVSADNSPAWNISGLETGKTWYVRARFKSGLDDNVTYGEYSDPLEITLASAPLTPTLELSNGIIPLSGNTTASWTYTSTDSTQQVMATIAEKVEDSYNVIATVRTPSQYTINPQLFGWHLGETHYIAVKVKSASGLESGWSNETPLTLANAPTCTITNTSLVTETHTSVDAEGETVSRTVKALKELPFTATVTGAGGTGTTTLIIENVGSYKVSRPDESDATIPDGTTVALMKRTGEGTFSIDTQNLMSSLDDGAYYKLTAIVSDSLGQKATASIDFTVNWTHQAKVPGATVEMDYEHLMAKLTPINPGLIVSDYRDFEPGGVNSSGRINEDTYARADRCREKAPFYGVVTIKLTATSSIYVYIKKYDSDGAPLGIETIALTSAGRTVSLASNVAAVRILANATSVDVVRDAGLQIEATAADYQETDTCDIYRLSADKPQLIYKGAKFGETYIDPYPTIGETGGHRFVTITKNGDYITDDNKLAWYDTGKEEGDHLRVWFNIFDFANDQAKLTYDVEISNSWKKAFEETQYLGGSTQGDWNPAINRTGSIKGTSVEAADGDVRQIMRKLAEHAGSCHVRTKDGSNYCADVQVSEDYKYAQGVKRAEYSLDITRVEQTELDGYLQET